MDTARKLKVPYYLGDLGTNNIKIDLTKMENTRVI